MDMGKLDINLPSKCRECRKKFDRGGWSLIDLNIYHDNNHVWPGYAGGPTGDDFGGSDF